MYELTLQKMCIFPHVLTSIISNYAQIDTISYAAVKSIIHDNIGGILPFSEIKKHIGSYGISLLLDKITIPLISRIQKPNRNPNSLWYHIHYIHNVKLCEELIGLGKLDEIFKHVFYIFNNDSQFVLVCQLETNYYMGVCRGLKSRPLRIFIAGHLCQVLSAIENLDCYFYTKMNQEIFK